MRTVNPYTIRLVTTGTTIADKQIVLPLGNAFDGIGQNEQIEDYVSVLADDAINPIVDYEKMRYSPVITSGGTKPTDSTLQYDFFFYGKPKWDDYKIIKKDDTANRFEDTPWRDAILYATPSTFKYGVVNAILKWSLSSAVLLRSYKAPQPTTQVANTHLNSNQIETNYFVNGVHYNQATSNPHHLNITATKNIYTAGDSFVFDEVYASLASPTSPSHYVMARNINISGYLELRDIPAGATITIKMRTGGYPAASFDQGVLLDTKGYEFTYEGSSQPTNEELYTSYPTNNIPSTYIEHSFKGYTNSFFRLDFYDSVLEEAQNLLFTDIMTVSEGKDPAEAVFYPKLTHNGATQNFYLYWLKDDPIIKEKGYRDVWMIARFFNAATGQVTQFMNIAEPAIYSLFPTINQYQTLFKYTKVRLYEDYTYMICQRHMASDVPANSNSSDDWNWMVEDSGAVGSERLILIQIRTKS